MRTRGFQGTKWTESLLKIFQSEATSSQEPLDQALREAMTQTASEFGYVFLYNDKSKTLTLCAWSEGFEKICTDMKPDTQYDPEAIGIWGETIKTAKPMILNSSGADVLSGHSLSPQSGSVTTLASAPVFDSDRIVLIWGLANTRGKYSPAQVRGVNLLMQGAWLARKRLISNRDTADFPKMFDQVINSLQLRIFWKDAHLKYLGCNDVFARDAGLARPRDIVGKTDDELAWKKDAEKFWRRDREVLDSGTAVIGYEEEVVMPDGAQTRWFRKHKVPLRNEKGLTSGILGIYEDITDLKNDQRHLLRLASIVEASDDAIIGADWRGIITDWNSGAVHMYGYTAGEIIGQPLTVLAPSDKIEEVSRLLNEIRKGRPIEHYETRRVRKSGEEFYIWLSVSAIRDDTERITGFSIIGRDVTAQRKISADLQRYRNFIENISDGCFELDLKGNIIFVNEIISRRLGYDRKDLIHALPQFYTGEAAYQQIAQVFKSIYETGHSATIDNHAIRDKDGNTRFISLSVSLMRDAEGEPAGFRGTTRDVTERLEAQQALRQSEEKYRSILESISEGYIEHDLNGNFIFVNDAACTMMGYPREELLTMNVRRIVSPRTARVVEHIAAEIIATGNPRRLVDYEVIRKDGTARIHQHNLSLIRNAQGEPMGIRVMGRDVTELKWAEEALRRSEERIRLLFRNIPVPTLVWKEQFGEYVLSEFNSAAFQFIGDKIIDALGKQADYFFMGMPQIAADIHKCMDSGQPVENQFWYSFDDRPEKRYVIVKYAYAPPDSVLMHVNDITGQKQAEENLQYISLHDSLTGLFNRFYADAEINRLASSRLRPVSIIVLDLNNLKKMNDDFGHATGDLYIKNAAALLKQTFRPEDMIARIGGDEFLVLLPLVEEHICALAIDRLQENIRSFNRANDFPLSLSAGFATTRVGDNLVERIREADKNMYLNKAAYKATLSGR